MSEVQQTKDRPIPWAVLVVALLVFLGGGWILWDMKPWTIKQVHAPAPAPTSTLKILGRDDEAARKAEAELESPASSPRPARSTSPWGAPAPSTSAR